MARSRSRSRSLSAATLLVLVVVAGLVYLVQQQHSTAQPPVPQSTTQTPATATGAASLAQLDGLEIGYLDAPGYERDAFGSGWKDPDRNGCDARNDILARDLTNTTFKPGTNNCVVLTGTLVDPYTDALINFTRGAASSEAVQIDHVVPLAWSWSHGTAAWSDERRVQFANDPANLRAVDGPTNGSKSDAGPADWLPPATGFACTYVQGFIAVLASYDLSIDEADAEASRRVLVGC